MHVTVVSVCLVLPLNRGVTSHARKSHRDDVRCSLRPRSLCPSTHSDTQLPGANIAPQNALRLLCYAL
jgi:hypothetical protein